MAQLHLHYNKFFNVTPTLFIVQVMIIILLIILVINKFPALDGTPVKIVLEADGSEIDAEDLPDMMPLIEPIMIMKETDHWTEVSYEL